MTGLAHKEHQMVGAHMDREDRESGRIEGSRPDSDGWKTPVARARAPRSETSSWPRQVSTGKAGSPAHRGLGRGSGLWTCLLWLDLLTLNQQAP